MIQFQARSYKLVLHCSVAYVITVILLVAISTLVRMIKTNPMGNVKAASTVTKDGLVERSSLAPPARRRSNMLPSEMNMPPSIDLMIRSIHESCAFATPA